MSLLDKYQQNSLTGFLFENSSNSNNSNNDLLSRYSSSHSSNSLNTLSTSTFGSIKANFNVYGIRGKNQDNFSVIDKMRGIQGGKVDIDGEISLSETYLDKSVDTKVMGGMYNQTMLDIYQDEKLFKAVYGLYTDGIVEEKENYMIEQDDFTQINSRDSNNSNSSFSSHLINSDKNTISNINNIETGTTYNKDISGIDLSLSKNKSNSTIHNNFIKENMIQNNNKKFNENSSSVLFSNQFITSSVTLSSVNSFMMSSVGEIHKVNKNTLNKVKAKQFNSQFHIRKKKIKKQSINVSSVVTNIQTLANDKPFILSKTKNTNTINSYNKSMPGFLKNENKKASKIELIEKKRELQEKLQALDKSSDELEYNMILKQIDKIDEELLKYLF